MNYSDRTHSPAFSIVIPTYNSAQTVRFSIDSIISQNFQNFEIIIVDGLSNDTTLDMIKSYNDDRIIIFSEKDNGIYDAMNKGIELAKGEWLYFLGSDDVLYSNDVLENIHDLIANSNIDVVYGDAFFKHSKVVHYGASSLERLLLDTNICHQAIFYKHSVFSKIGKYNLKYFLYADWDLNIRCFMHPDLVVKYINLIISIYNDAEGLSAKQYYKDLNFINILPSNHIRLQKEYYLSTIEYIIGQKILNFLKLPEKILRKIR